jgi:hypothetical protein
MGKQREKVSDDESLFCPLQHTARSEDDFFPLAAAFRVL